MGRIGINAARLEQSIKEMGMIGRVPEAKGVTRLALSNEDKSGRDLFRRWLAEAGLEIRIDAMGNIFGLRPGTDPDAPSVMIGSHLDSVKNAGMFDGAVGVLGGLEVIRALNDNNIKTKRTIIVANFTNEEGARFQLDMMGSAFFSGKKTAEELYAIADDCGLTVGDELERIGYKGSQTVSVGNYLEFHIEQGPVLDAEGVNIGVVEGIQGISWWKCEYIGEANHAGSTPLHLRRDALLGAATLALELNKLAKRIGNACVVTMGRIKTYPDVINIVPGRCSFTVDFRQYSPALFEKGKYEINQLVKECAKNRGLASKFKKLADVDPVVFDKSMTTLIENSAKELGLSTKRLYSGAGHDAQFLAKVCPTAMIFVPSLGGRSHSPEEWTEFSDIADGCNVLMRSALKLAIIDV